MTGPAAGALSRYYLLANDRTVLTIGLDAPSASNTADPMVAELTEVVESFQFDL